MMAAVNVCPRRATISSPQTFERFARPFVASEAFTISRLARDPAGRIGEDGLKALLAPCPPEEMICWPVSARVGNVKNNDPSRSNGLPPKPAPHPGLVWAP